MSEQKDSKTKSTEQGNNLTRRSKMILEVGIVQQILISRGGQIRVESQFGKGATFYVTLPISNAIGTIRYNEN